MEGDKNKVQGLVDSFKNLSFDGKIQFQKEMNEALKHEADTALMSADDSKKLATKLVKNLIG